MSKALSRKEREVIQIVQDPVLWVREHIGKPRWYQELVLRHPHHRMVLRMGRRLGKCIAGSERILDPVSGRYVSVEELYNKGIQSPRLYSLHTNMEDQIQTNAFHIEDNGLKEVFEVRTVEGSKVKLTGNHPVLTKRGWVEVDDLLEDDSIALPTELPYSGGYYVSKEEMDDWIEQSPELPEDIYEWSINSLDSFLLTYIERYGVSKEYVYSEDGYQNGIDLCFDSSELAREFKHLFLRLGKVSEIIKNKEMPSSYRRKGYILRVKDSITGDYYYSPLKSVKSVGEEQTFDVHVPETHNLVVEDVFVHNTWTMASHMLWVAMTAWGGRLARDDKKGIDILVVTPYDIQAKEIYNTLNKMIDENEALSSSLELRRQGPPREIKFLNGGTIKLFTAGTSSSNDAASIRGQRADKTETL